MTEKNKRPRQATKRSASGLLIKTGSNNDHICLYTGDLADDYHFLAPYEICAKALGLLFCLMTKRLTSVSFSTLYQRSEKRSWMDLLICERRNLKPNTNSIEKCFTLNRLIAACTKNPNEFSENATQLYEEIRTRMTSTDLTLPTIENLYNAIQFYQNLQYQRRLFYINHDEAKQPETLLSLQRATTNWYLRLLRSSLVEEKNQLKTLLQHSFIIVTQPSIPECVAGVKYEKLGNTYVARLYSRIVCLLDVDEIRTHLTFSDIKMTLFSLNRQLHEEGEIQELLQWEIRKIIDGKGSSSLFHYAEVHSIKLNKSDLRSLRPLYSSKLCQLQFQFKIRIETLDIEENVVLISRPFGLCSHAQYFPEYVSKILIYEIEQITPNTDNILQPNTVTDFLCRYHTRITGVQVKPYTKQIIFQEMKAAYEVRKNYQQYTSIQIYEGILSKLINQMEFLVDHPYLSMMYDDNLFLGICTSTIDNELHGTPEQPVILLRFDAVTERSSSSQASVRYIVHNGQLIKASFHSKAFVDEMCYMICESNSEKAKTFRMLTDTTERTFHDFSLYCDNELFRLSTVSPPARETYKPLIPVLWSTMRSMSDYQTKQIPSSPLSDTESIGSNTSLKSQSEITSTNIDDTNSPSMVFNENFINYLAKKVPEMFMKLQLPLVQPIASSISAEDIIKQNHSIISNLIGDYMQTITTQAQFSTQILDSPSDIKPNVSCCLTSSNT